MRSVDVVSSNGHRARVHRGNPWHPLAEWMYHGATSASRCANTGPLCSIIRYFITLPADYASVVLRAHRRDAPVYRVMGTVTVDRDSAVVLVAWNRHVANRYLV